MASQTPSLLLYSSHNRCEYIHRQWIVERALRHPTNKTILYLPMSVANHHQQSSWETFRWYFDRFQQWGLSAIPFYWTESLSKQDVDLLFDYLANYEVVILGGGSSPLGMHRYRELGKNFYNDPNRFQRTLQKRLEQEKLTVGFSAGAAQLGQFLAYVAYHDGEDSGGFGTAKNIIVTAHHEWGRESEISTLAKKFPQCLVFGLPNDSGLAIAQGNLPSGRVYQVIEFLLDYSWEVAEDSWHIKTRQGMKIEHFYFDSRHWAFNNGDKMVRIMSPDSQYRKVWILQSGVIRDYWTQEPSEFKNIEQIFKDH